MCPHGGKNKKRKDFPQAGKKKWGGGKGKGSSLPFGKRKKGRKKHPFFGYTVLPKTHSTVRKQRGEQTGRGQVPPQPNSPGGKREERGEAIAHRNYWVVAKISIRVRKKKESRAEPLVPSIRGEEKATQAAEKKPTLIAKT